MNNDIKEILNLFKNEDVNGFIISDELYQNLKDYITNLQEENRLLKMSILEKQFPDLNAVVVEIDTYKSRNEKAIEFLEQKPFGIAYVEVSKLLNILKGDNNES